MACLLFACDAAIAFASGAGIDYISDWGDTKQIWKNMAGGTDQLEITRLWPTNNPRFALSLAFGDREQVQQNLSSDLYEARYGACLARMVLAPGSTVTVKTCPVLSAVVTFPKPTSSTKEFVTHRDGEPVDASRRTLPAGRKVYEYEWTDRLASAGQHQYSLQVVGVLKCKPSLVTVESGPVNVPLHDRRIAFLRNGDVWTMNGDGSSQKQITSFGDCIRLITGADPGSVIVARSSNEIGLNDLIYSVDLATGLTRLLAAGNHPALSPDGRLLAYDVLPQRDDHYDSENRRVYIVYLDNGKKQRLISNWQSFDYWLGPTVEGWDKKGDVLFLSADNGTLGSIRILGVPLSSGQAYDIGHGWAAQSTASGRILHLSWVGRPEGGRDHFPAVIDLAGRGSPVPICNWELGLWDLCVSPSGTKAALRAEACGPDASARFVGRQIIAIHDFTSDNQPNIIFEAPRVTEEKLGRDYGPLNWSPDEEWLLLKCSQDRAGETAVSLWAMRPDGSDLTQIADDVDAAIVLHHRPYGPDTQIN